jgi:A118 family predicted phage portal protein
MNQSKLSAITTVVSKQGQNVIAGTQYDLIQVFKSWYRGDVNDFHRYTEIGINGISRDREKLTFGIPKKIAEEWSSILWNEKVEITTDREEVNERLDYVFEQNAMKVEYGNLIEKTFGYVGTGATVEYLIDGDTVIDYITGEYVIVTQGKGTQAKGIITINEIEEEDSYITHLTIHTLIGGRYVIEHQAFASVKESELGSRSRGSLRHIFTQT